MPSTCWCPCHWLQEPRVPKLTLLRFLLERLEKPATPDFVVFFWESVIFVFLKELVLLSYFTKKRLHRLCLGNCLTIDWSFVNLIEVVYSLKRSELKLGLSFGMILRQRQGREGLRV